MTIILSTWIPRSYIHLREAFSKIEKTKLKIKNIKFDENLSFDIENIFENVTLNFTLTPVGIYTLIADFPKNVDKKNALIKMQKILLETLIKNWHTVTYGQIKEGIIPLKYSVFDFSAKVNSESKNKLDKNFKNKYFSKKKSEYQSLQFVLILTAVIDDYVVKMSQYYHKADKVITSLKGDFELSELKHTVFEMDYIEKNTGEIISRIKDSQSCLERETELLINIIGKKSTLDKKYMFLIFKRTKVDLDYTERLWQQMDIMLNNLDNTSSARLSYQETIESRRVEWFLSVPAASIIATLVASAFISEFTGVNAVYSSFIFLLVLVSIYYLTKKIRAK